MTIVVIVIVVVIVVVVVVIVIVLLPFECLRPCLHYMGVVIHSEGFPGV